MGKAKDSSGAHSFGASNAGVGSSGLEDALGAEIYDTSPQSAASRQPTASKRVRAAQPRSRAALADGSTPSKVPPLLTPEDLLRRAMQARTPRARGRWARQGLAARSPLDRTTHSMLLRQLYLAHFEVRHFRQAADVSEQALKLGVLPDVTHQDAARAKQALGDIDGAAGHLRLAARISPPHRKAFHWWTLGSLYYLAGRYDEAVSAMTRAARWGTTDKPLYLGHLAVIRCESGQPPDHLPELIEALSEVPAGQGYGRFVLGQLAFFDRRWDMAKRCLEAFVQRTTSGRPALAIALSGELRVAQRTLESIRDR